MPATDFFDDLEKIRNRPAMFFSPDHTVEQWVRQLDLVIAGYESALEKYAPSAPGYRFRARFGEYVRSAYGWDSPRGPLHAILAHTSASDDTMQVLWTIIDEYRVLTQGDQVP